MFYNCFSSVVVVIIMIINIMVHYDVFTQALADALSLEFKWQRVFSSLQNSSQYSGQS